MTDLPDYKVYSRLMDIDPNLFKWKYFRMIQDVHKIIFEPLDMWGKWLNNKDGIIKYNMWLAENRINTHPKVLQFFCEKLSLEDPTIIDDLLNDRYDSIVIKLKPFILKNKNVFYALDGNETIESRTIKGLLSDSWFSGNLSVIAVVNELYNFDSNITSIDYDFETGNKNDMDGDDVTIEYNYKPQETIQIKSGGHDGVLYGNYYYIKGSPNNLQYNTTYYAYGSVGTKASSVIIFKNIKDNPDLLSKTNNGAIKVHKDIVVYKINKSMGTTEKIRVLANIIKKKHKLNSIEIIKDEKEESYVKINKTNDSISIVINYNDNSNVMIEDEIDKAILELK